MLLTEYDSICYYLCIMKLAKYLENNSNRKALSKTLCVSTSVLYQWSNNIRPVPIIRCKAIVIATNGQVTFKDLRPNDWHLIWEYPNLPKKFLSNKNGQL